MKARRITAAMLAVLLLTGCRADASVTEIARAEYPEMSPYPAEEGSPLHEFQYEAWNADRMALRRQPEGYKEGLDGYFTAVIREFMTDTDGENRVFSPMSLYMALAMTAETADGESRDQILSLLGYDSIEELRWKAKSVWQANYIDDSASRSIAANSLWLNDSIVYRQETVDLLAENYYASVFCGRMGSDGYNLALQSWLNEQTGGMLTEPVSSESMDEKTVLSLVSAMTYSARWMGEFRKDMTEPGVFHGAQGDETAEFMQHKEMDDYYYWADSFAAYCMDLENAGEVWFVLPDEGVTTDEVLAGDDFYRLIYASDHNGQSQWESKVYIKINLAIPKFSVRSELDLTKGLKTLGVTDVFSGEDADFSPLTVDFDEPVWLDQAKQAVTIEMDEEGVAAAAYTKMRYYGAPPPPEEVVDFICDRPFLFAVLGNDGTPLFTGVVNSVN